MTEFSDQKMYDHFKINKNENKNALFYIKRQFVACNV